jgi:hypothetical protein
VVVIAAAFMTGYFGPDLLARTGPFAEPADPAGEAALQQPSTERPQTAKSDAADSLAGPLLPSEVISTAVAEPGPGFSWDTRFSGAIIEVRPARPDDAAIRVGDHPDVYLLIRTSGIIDRGIARFDAGTVVAFAVTGGTEWFQHIAGRDVVFQLCTSRGQIRSLSALTC